MNFLNITVVYLKYLKLTIFFYLVWKVDIKENYLQIPLFTVIKFLK